MDDAINTNDAAADKVRRIGAAVQEAAAAGVDRAAIEAAVGTALGAGSAPADLAAVLVAALGVPTQKAEAVAAAVRGEVGAMMNEPARRRDAYLRARSVEIRAETAVLFAKNEAAEVERQRRREADRRVA